MKYGFFFLSMLCALFLILIPTGVRAAEEMAHLWSHGYGSIGSDVGNSVVVDGSDNVIVSGWYEEAIDLGGGPLSWNGETDLFFAKYDLDGNHIWSRGFGGALWDRANGIAVDSSDNVLFTGVTYSSLDFGGGPIPGSSVRVYLAKFDSDGNHVWSNGYDGDFTSYTTSESIVIDSSDNVVITGRYYDSIDFGGGPLTSNGEEDVFVAKFDASGSHLWSLSFGSIGRDFSECVTVDGSGNVIITGSFAETIDFGGGSIVSSGSSDIFVAKFDASGNHLWSYGFGETGFDRSFACAVDSNERIVVTGLYRGPVDFGGGPISDEPYADIFLAKFAPDGTHIWSRGFGDSGYHYSYGLSIDSTGKIIMTGRNYNGTVDFGGGALSNDVFLAKFDSTGQHVSSYAYGDDGCGYSVTFNSLDDVVATGSFRGTIDFGGGSINSQGIDDLVLVNLSFNPTVPTTVPTLGFLGITVLILFLSRLLIMIDFSGFDGGSTKNL